MEGECEYVPRILNMNTGHVLATLINDCCGDKTLVLAGEGPDGTDLKLTFSAEWLEVNSLSSILGDDDENEQIFDHASKCKNQGCRQALIKNLLLGKFFQENDPIYLLEQVATINTFRYENEIRLVRGKGFDHLIDGLNPFFLWMLGNAEFWQWPDHNPPQLPV